MTTGAATRPQATSPEEELIPRYSFLERINHWLGALAYTYLLITGLAFWSPYLFWLVIVVGGGTVAPEWHPWFGLLFSSSTLCPFFAWGRAKRITEDKTSLGRSIPDFTSN